jgi:hypothetical protein
MTLGNLIGRLHDDAFVEETLAGLDDLVLLARLRQAADAAQVSLGTLASAVVGHFVQHADAEKWLALMTAASRAQDPAAASLHCMLRDAALPAENDLCSTAAPRIGYATG